MACWFVIKMLVLCVRMEVYLKIGVLTLSKKRMIGYGFNTVGLSGRIKRCGERRSFGYFAITLQLRNEERMSAKLPFVSS